MELISKIGFGGGCHWCTEAVFQFLHGVVKVEQGWITSVGENENFSEAVIVHFNSKLIPFSVLIEIHLYTHKSMELHSMRRKYRSAIYSFSESQQYEIEQELRVIQQEFKQKIITKVLPFNGFKPSQEEFQGYYQKNPEKPFCKKYIDPKLNLLLREFSGYTNAFQLDHLKIS